MSHDTTAINRQRQDFSNRDSVWLFGYGSLIYKAGFDFLERQAAHIQGWERRFWQGSHDHRGTPEAPGRVLTLIPVEGAECGGMAYRITPGQLDAIDEREKNGYLRTEIEFHLADGRHVLGLVYVADPHNAAWLGPATDEEIARHIAPPSGPRGPTPRHLLPLAAAPRAMALADPPALAP